MRYEKNKNKTQQQSLGTLSYLPGFLPQTLSKSSSSQFWPLVMREIEHVNDLVQLILILGKPTLTRGYLSYL